MLNCETGVTSNYSFWVGKTSYTGQRSYTILQLLGWHNYWHVCLARLTYLCPEVRSDSASVTFGDNISKLNTASQSVRIRSKKVENLHNYTFADIVRPTVRPCKAYWEFCVFRTLRFFRHGQSGKNEFRFISTPDHLPVYSFTRAKNLSKTWGVETKRLNSD